MFVRIFILVAVAVLVWSATAHSSQAHGRKQVVTVKPYDTLWSIASSHYGGDPRGAIYRLEQRNGLDGTVVRPGQKLVLP